MSSKIIKIKDFVIYILLVALFGSLLLLAPIYNLGKSNLLPKRTDKVLDVSNGISKVDAILNDLPENREVVSKYVINNQYTSVLLHSVLPEEINLYESHIYNSDGKEVLIDDLLKKEEIDNFWNKVYELLSLKYPEFIVNGIKSSSGINAYEIKENEMIIYFMNYTIEPIVNELITLKVNYNEIKDYINFTCKLDEIYSNEDGFLYSKSKNTVALTFDDGPSGTKTSEILKILNKNKAHASFFMVGNKMKANKNGVLEVYNSGNEIGSHTYAHGNLTRQTFEERVDALSKTDTIYNEITGDTIKLLRPPYGSYKKEMLSELNYSVVLWNIDTEDWRYRNVDRIISTVLDNLSDGSIILMHDSYDTTVEAVEKLLPILYSKGYQVVSVSELAKLKDVELELNTSYRKIK